MTRRLMKSIEKYMNLKKKPNRKLLTRLRAKRELKKGI